MAKLTLPAYKLKWTSPQQRFRDNDNFEISEADLREFALDTVDTFGLADALWNYRGAFVAPVAPATLVVARGDVFTYGRGLWQVLEAGSVSTAPAAGTQWRQLLELGYQDGGVFVPDTNQAVRKDWVYTYGRQRWRATRDMVANAAPTIGNWALVLDATTDNTFEQIFLLGDTPEATQAASIENAGNGDLKLRGQTVLGYNYLFFAPDFTIRSDGQLTVAGRKGVLISPVTEEERLAMPFADLSTGAIVYQTDGAEPGHYKVGIEQWEPLLQQDGLIYGGPFRNAGQTVQHEWVYTYKNRLYQWLGDTGQAEYTPDTEGSMWLLLHDYNQLQPRSVTANMLAVETANRLLPAAYGVLTWYNGAPLGFYPTLSAASDAIGPGSGSKVVLYQVYGRVGTSASIQYVSQSCTIHLMPGAVLTTDYLPLFFGQENEYASRTIRLTGEGELVGDIWNHGCSQGVRLEVECAKWTGQLRHTGYFGAPRTEYWFRGVRINTPAGKVSFTVAYQYGGFYSLPAFIWLDTCILTNPDSDISEWKGTQADGAGANPGDTQTANMLRLTNTTLYKSGGRQLLNQAQGGATLEQDTATGAGDGTQVDLTNYNTKAQDAVLFAPKRVPVLDSANVVFTQEALYTTRFSGTFTVDATGAVPGVDVWAYLGPSATEPSIPASYVKRGGAFASGRTNTYAFLVRPDGSIEYYIQSE